DDGRLLRRPGRGRRRRGDHDRQQQGDQAAPDRVRAEHVRLPSPSVRPRASGDATSPDRRPPSRAAGGHRAPGRPRSSPACRAPATRPAGGRPIRVRPRPDWASARRRRAGRLPGRRPCADWRRHHVLVRPDTVLRWHRRGWRLYWWWRSGRPTGRPRVPPEVRALIRRLSEENRLWGTERIRGELLRLGIAVANGSIRRYRWRPAPRPPSQTWRTFLRNHAAQIWAADLFTGPTVAFRTLYVLFFVTHGRRELVHCPVTAHPTAAWVWRQLVEATAWGRRPRYLLRDRDAVYGRDFRCRAEALGVHTLLAPFRAPRANAIAGRVLPPVRNERLDHVLVLK